ncbi:MAG: formylglycine-generating enzyme family protein [Planctomyces sp.]|jgi:formylglycine-generating enzyme required for sulfatase activity
MGTLSKKRNHTKATGNVDGTEFAIGEPVVKKCLLLFLELLSCGCSNTGAPGTGNASTSVPPQTATSGGAEEPAGDSRKVVSNGIGIELVWIPAGTFTMGSSKGEEYNPDETPHKVTLTKPFYISRTEITQGQWKKLMGTEPWKGETFTKEGESYPATFVNWSDTAEFCAKLSAFEGKVYRLPTEAEWEFACRAGTSALFSFGNDLADFGQYGWYDGNTWDAGEKYAHEVGQKLPNPFGLHDMHGNVWEWCSDWYGDYPSGDVRDPHGPNTGDSRVLRGGFWNIGANSARSAGRFQFWPERRSYGNGFRIVQE